MKRFSLEGRMALVVAASAVIGALVFAGVAIWPFPQAVAWLDELAKHPGQPVVPGPPQAVDTRTALTICVLVLVPLSAWIAHILVEPIRRLLRALESAVASYRDGDYSMSIGTDRTDELGDLIRMHNQLGTILREQRQNLAQRELLLDTVVQNTPVALVLTDAAGKVTYANIAARHLFNEGRALAGLDFSAVLEAMPENLRAAAAAGEDALFTVEMEGSEETFHLSQRGFRLQGRPHRLQLYRRMTRELSRQEVHTWKRVIRVISHELNNSLAPISSLSHSGAELARRGDLARLPGVFASIGDRAKHLHGFIAGYASFAKLPAPQPREIAWEPFLEALSLHCCFKLTSELPRQPGWFDPTQIEQVLINLVKNAHEAGGDEDEVTLGVHVVGRDCLIDVSDRGPGMSETVLAQALLPFYSTKRSGTGLGLALAREISEAHGGRIALSNRDGGGLRVTLVLPIGPH
ncbi:sensor histidine kinase [Luteibacter yeojuensis]|uniref:histidine kinase n=1 Tax=Luteibacter yeojuensis TaxID=345309 RepID=A0A0F3K5Z4_9GAMM|nr:ATP-binding protein [Luteibacter yeojuensis]KJV26675.1 histidine kinase [Luteibacter yeojuensis]